MSDIQSQLIDIMLHIGIWGILLSIIVNIILSFLPIPSFFITYINIVVYGLFGGFIVSLMGEVAAAVVSFIIFRKGLSGISRKELSKFKRFMKIIDADNKEAFKLILVFRLFPYVPSGIITYFAAIGKVDLKTFVISSTIGKIPAMIIEVLIVYGISQLPLKWILTIISIILIGIVVNNYYRKGD